jgi:hypothetical protein
MDLIEIVNVADDEKAKLLTVNFSDSHRAVLFYGNTAHKVVSQITFCRIKIADSNEIKEEIRTFSLYRGKLASMPFDCQPVKVILEPVLSYINALIDYVIRGRGDSSTSVYQVICSLREQIK